MAKLAINTLAPSVKVSSLNGTHMEGTTFDAAYFFEAFDESGREGVVEAWADSKGPVNIASHGIDTPINGEKSRMVGPT